MFREIYLIDDDDIVNTINSVHFRKLGMEDRVRSFVNPELALDTLRFRQNKDDRTLILLDLNMPEMTGFEFLKTNEVLLVTSSDSEADKEEAKKFSKYVKGYIIKPLKTEFLEDFLQKSFVK